MLRINAKPAARRGFCTGDTPPRLGSCRAAKLKPIKPQKVSEID
jgi:hypothetical protein